MPKVFTCPFWSYEKNGRSFCEGARLSFKSIEKMVSYQRKYCCAVPGWEQCSIAAGLMAGEKITDGGKRNG